MILNIVIVLLILLLVNWWLMKPFYWKQKKIPYSEPVSIFGLVFNQIFSPFYKFWGDLYKTGSSKNGFYGFHMFGNLVVMVSDTEAIKEILVQKYDCFNSRGVYSNPEHDPLAKNVFHVSGEEWKRIRSKLTPYFSPSRLRNMTEMMSSNMKEFYKQFEHAAECKKTINVNDTSLKLSTDIVVNTIFGIEPDSFSNPNSFFFLLQEQLFGHSFILRVLLGTISPFLYDLFKVTIIPRETTAKLKQFIDEVVAQRLNNIGIRQDFIQGMIDLVSNNSAIPPSSKSKTFSIEDATAQCMVMFLGGTETSGNAISYLLFELAIHQEIQDKLREEIKQVLENADGTNFTYDHLNSLTYTNMVINETLRKYPILPIMTRECTKATNVAGVDIEVGTKIFVPIMALHWDPKYYPEPEKFIPERFSIETYNEKTIYMPFGLGPRTCIGLKMAIVEIAFALCTILPTFKILPSEKTKSSVIFNRKPTLNPKDGIWLNVERI